LIRIVGLFLVIILSFPIDGQVIQKARYELTEAGDGSEYKLLPWDENGLLVYRRVELEGTSDVLHLLKLDTALNEKWVNSVSVSKQLSLTYAKCYGKKAHFLFKPRAGFGDFQLFSLNADTAASFLYTIKNVIPFNPIFFEVSDKSLVIAGYYNYRPVAIHFSMFTGQSKLLPGFFNDPGELNQLTINQDETIDVVVNMRNTEKKLSLWVMNFSSEGMPIKNTIIHPTPDRNLLFGRMVKFEGDSSVVAGVYGKNHEYSRGVFVASVNPAGEYKVRYYNFADLKNFFKYLKVARQNRIQERIERKQMKGKKARFNYRIAVHEFVPYLDHYLLLGEAFYPVYKNSAYTTGRPTSSFGRYSMSNVNWQRDFTFDGYRYTHAVTLGIARDGRLLWDNTFEIKNVKSYTLDQYVHSLPGKNLVMLYSSENKIFTKIIQGTQVVTPKSEDPIRGKFEADKIKRSSLQNHQLDYWYGRNLISYGTQDVQNLETPRVALNRRVFYINKITFKE
jgi:hypothetical protein